MSSKRSRPTSATAALPSSTRPLRFASWNVLADSLLRQNSWLYQSCDPEALHDRLPRIFNGVERLEPDVLAMQEVEHFARDMEPRLSELGFSGVYKQRTGDDQTDGVALVWRNERLAAEQIEYVEYASALTAGVKDPRSLEMLKKHNVAIIALLRDLESGKLLVVATTHILWNPRRGWVKLQQLNHLFARVDAMRRGAAATEAAVDVTSNDVGTTSCGESADDGGIGQSTGATLPAVVLGDFNCTPASMLHGFLLGWPLQAPLHSERYWDGQEEIQNLTRAFRKHGTPQPWPRAPVPPRLPPPIADHDRSRGEVSASPPRQRPPPPAQPPPLSAEVHSTHALAGELASAYGHLGEPECTSFHRGFQGAVDYILATRADFVVQTVLPLPSREELARRRSLPDAHCPSDHLPVACELAWRDQQQRGSASDRRYAKNT